MLSPTLLLKQRKCLKTSLCKINFLCLKRIHFAVSSPPKELEALTRWTQFPSVYFRNPASSLSLAYHPLRLSVAPNVHLLSPCWQMLQDPFMNQNEHGWSQRRSGEVSVFLPLSCHLKYLVGTNKACGVGLATHNQTQTQRSYYWLSECGWLILCTE